MKPADLDKLRALYFSRDPTHHAQAVEMFNALRIAIQPRWAYEKALRDHPVPKGAAIRFAMAAATMAAACSQLSAEMGALGAAMKRATVVADTAVRLTKIMAQTKP